MVQGSVEQPSTGRRSWVRTPPPENTPSTEDWVRIAREVLIKQGILAVKINNLAQIAGVTRGGFYWRFKSRDELFEALIEDWRESNTAPMLRVLRADGMPRDRMRALAKLFIDGRDFSEAYDSAVRAWAALSPSIAEIVRTVDDIRLHALEDLFRDAGFDAGEAMIRARITSFHQIGYYALGLRESADERRSLVDRYTAALLNQPTN